MYLFCFFLKCATSTAPHLTHLHPWTDRGSRAQLIQFQRRHDSSGSPCPPLRCTTTGQQPAPLHIHEDQRSTSMNEWIRRLRIANIRIRSSILRGVLAFSWQMGEKSVEIGGNRGNRGKSGERGGKSVLERVNRTRNKQDGQTANRTLGHTLYLYIFLLFGGAGNEL